MRLTIALCDPGQHPDQPPYSADMIEDRVRLRPEIETMLGYDAGPQTAPGAFRLAGNETPFPPLPSVIRAVLSEQDELGRYPDASLLRVRTAIAEHHAVDVSSVHASAGSVAVIYQFMSAVAGPGDEVVLASRTFEAYPKAITVAGASAVVVPNRADQSHDLDGMADAIGPRTRAVLVCTPNNPTGNTISRKRMLDFLNRVPVRVPVLLDEAYVQFDDGEDRLDGMLLLPDHPNLFVLRTFSKAYGLAGLRVGYAVGEPSVLASVRRSAVPFLVSEQAQAAAVASLAATDELERRVQHIVEARGRLRTALLEQGWEVPASGGNFLWLPTGRATEAITEMFTRHGLLVRAFPGAGIRITVAEDETFGVILETAAAARSAL